MRQRKTGKWLLLLCLLSLSTACHSALSGNRREEAPAAGRRKTFVCDSGVTISYEEIGRGSRVLLFLHGFGSSSRNWADVVGRFDPESHRILLLDLKGCGASSKPDDGKYSMSDQSEIIIRLIEEERLDGITLIGHSMGGGICLLIALQAAERPPLEERLEGLVLIDSTAYSTEIPFFIRYLRAPVVRTLVSETLPPRSQAQFVLRRIFYDPDRATDELVERYAGCLRDPEARRAARDMAAQIVPDNHRELAARFPTISQPTLIIWGRDDPVLPVEDAYRLHASLPDSELAVIERCGHVPQEEAPAETYRLIARFLRVQAGGRRRRPRPRSAGRRIRRRPPPGCPPP